MHIVTQHVTKCTLQHGMPRHAHHNIARRDMWLAMVRCSAHAACCIYVRVRARDRNIARRDVHIVT
jgi:hypothetical protein